MTGGDDDEQESDVKVNLERNGPEDGDCRDSPAEPLVDETGKDPIRSTSVAQPYFPTPFDNAPSSNDIADGILPSPASPKSPSRSPIFELEPKSCSFRSPFETVDMPPLESQEYAPVNNG